MKKALSICLILFVLSACSSDDGSLRAEFIPILSVQAPAQLIVGQASDFQILFNRPTSCHGFLRFDVAAKNNEQTIGLIAGKIGNNCQPVDEIPRENVFSFTPSTAGLFIFRFLPKKTLKERMFLRFLKLKLRIIQTDKINYARK
ncbi:MAG: hypothetical protein CO119_03475 [Flavobacteriales bacterium CG_4_9_14_3_um_filter_40_17]|nr:MAG: hypothetical protein CO119_03475 [Flavobacteriales bacterium CG_4_9_14_3_um_filter_40_17]